MWLRLHSRATVRPHGPARAYIVGCARTDISPDLRRFNVIGSVGTNAQWNDDIGERGYATIDLDVAGGS